MGRPARVRLPGRRRIKPRHRREGRKADGVGTNESMLSEFASIAWLPYLWLSTGIPISFISSGNVEERFLKIRLANRVTSK